VTCGGRGATPLTGRRSSPAGIPSCDLTRPSQARGRISFPGSASIIPRRSGPCLAAGIRRSTRRFRCRATLRPRSSACRRRGGHDAHRPAPLPALPSSPSGSARLRSSASWRSPRPSCVCGPLLAEGHLDVRGARHGAEAAATAKVTEAPNRCNLLLGRPAAAAAEDPHAVSRHQLWWRSPQARAGDAGARLPNGTVDRRSRWRSS
jgi:hypothetical protein